jgi:hypothetical protein
MAPRGDAVMAEFYDRGFDKTLRLNSIQLVEQEIGCRAFPPNARAFEDLSSLHHLCPRRVRPSLQSLPLMGALHVPCV